MKERYGKVVRMLGKTTFIPIMLIRIMVAYGLMLHYNIPGLLASSIYTVSVGTGLEACLKIFLIVLLVLGLGTRLISFFLIISLLVELGSFQWLNSFEATGGIERPLYYVAMLMLLLVFGAGKISLDFWIRKYWRKYASNREPQIEINQAEYLIDVRWHFYEDF